MISIIITYRACTHLNFEMSDEKCGRVANPISECISSITVIGSSTHPIVLLVIAGVDIGIGVGIEIGIVSCFEIIALLGGLCAKLIRIGFHTSGDG